MWGDPFKKLIAHPKISPYLLELLGAYVRLDHDYAIFIDQGTSRGGLHGGPDIVGEHWCKCRGGTKLRTASHERIYSPGHLAWSLNYYDLESYGELTEQQQRMLFPPSIGNGPKVDANL